MTVLFADLAAFTSRAEAMDPEDVAAFLDSYHAQLKAELERFGGSVEKFIGDAVMAIFGAPVSHEDDPERAVRAALAIRDWADDEGIELRVGINTGEALVTLSAQPTEGQSMAAGDVVNTAARLQAAAPLNAILVGEQTFRATEKVIEFVAAEPFEAKGKAQPVAAWQVVAPRSRASVERAHGSTLVGRQRELDVLAGALERAREERSSQLVTLVGVPGIGKSRLVFELYARIEQETEVTFWRYGRCLSYGEGMTFWALGEMVKAHAGILEGDTEEEAERKLRHAVDDPWMESHLRPLVGLPGGADGGGERREEAFTAWRRFFEGLADERTLVLVFEDVHWADENLLDFVDHLVDWATGVPLLVVCTARPELFGRRPGWGGGKPNAHTISLSSLTDVETAQLLGGLLERSLLPAEAQAQLLARAGGNPLYAEEYARMLRERGNVEHPPETVHGMIAARLDLLDGEQKALVQDASVVGSTFWLGAVSALGGNEQRATEERLHGLERKEFIRRARSSTVADDVEYAFRHVLVRDVAHNQIPRAERAEKHLAAAGWLESLGRAEDHSELLAYHYLQALELAAAAGVDTQTFAGGARTALVDAGDRAYALSAYEAAGRYFRTALDLSAEDDFARGRLLLRLGRALMFAGGLDPELLERARDVLLAGGDNEGAAEAETTLAEHLWLEGERDLALAYLDSALAHVESLPASTVKAHAISTASRFRMLAAENEEAIRLGGEALAMAEALELGEIRAATLNNIGTARVALGDRRGFDELAQAVLLADEANAPFELCRAKGNLAALLWVAGEASRAVELWREAAVDADRFGQRTFGRWFQGILIEEYALGAWDSALKKADAFIAEVEGGLPHYLAADTYGRRALMRLGRDQAQLARDDAEQGVVLARRIVDPQALLPALARLAHVYCELGEREAAAPLVDEYLALFVAGGRFGHALSSVHLISWSMADLGRGDELLALPDWQPSPWVDAGLAFAAGDPRRAAEICAQMGTVTDEAYARLAAAKSLLEQGRRAEGLEELDRAVAFYRSVGATRYVREGESLRAEAA
ncbi:MAG: hypothetical protein QOE29_391 [Gaiellaceae bacterium]|nr:hypothetical protein [Gaiellaceae bacterium]